MADWAAWLAKFCALVAAVAADCALDSACWVAWSMRDYELHAAINSISVRVPITLTNVFIGTTSCLNCSIM